MKTTLFFLIMSISCIVHAQTYTQLLRKADTAYQHKQYTEAAGIYLKAIDIADFQGSKPKGYYSAACCYALAGDTEHAFDYLHQAIANGYSHTGDIANDGDLVSLHTSSQWAKVLTAKSPEAGTDPYKARLITSDIDNFWEAYDRAQEDTAHRYAIYKKYYIDKGSPGMQDYFAGKILTLKNFVKGHDRMPKFYASIRKNTYAVNQQKKQMQAGFVKFKQIYPQARFPDIYFIIGSFMSAGTSSDRGLLIGIDQAVRTVDVKTKELTLWQNSNLSELNEFPNLIAHELVHYQQGDMGLDTTLLKAVLVEGMADFLGKLASGKTANERLHRFAKGRERQIWNDFKKEMYLDRANNWIANSDQETPEHPADLGYWVGYQICKAYYDQSRDKKQAVYDMLHIKNYRLFYEQSRVEMVMKSKNR